jgi:Carboxypeptidase regulatory-like domain
VKRSPMLRLPVLVVLVGLLAGAGHAQVPENVAGVVATAQTNAQSRREAKQSASATKYEITGVVINSVSGDTVSRCRLTATLNQRGGFGNRQFPSANDFACDAHGRFTVTVPSAGSWRLVASARGFVSQAYDAHPPYASAIVLTLDAPTKDLEFRISPEASIIGVVLDEAGEAVRNAQIMVQAVPPKSPGGPPSPGGMRGNAKTDDRGMYEVPNLAPGDYRISVHAQPWYAAGRQNGVPNNNTPSPLDPSLDYAYAVTWFPGVSDATQAETITLHAGDTRQADFHMIPIPSIHLKILSPPIVSEGPNQRVQPSFPIVQQVGGGGPGGFIQTTTRMEGSGQIDVGGLTPGVYQIRMTGPNQDGHVALVEVSGSAARTVDMSTPERDLARITVHVDGLSDMDSSSRGDRGVPISLIDRDGNNGTFSSNRGEGGPGRGAGREQKDAGADRVMEVPPGRYEVVVQGRPNVFLTGLTAKGAATSGRYVIVGAGDSTLTVHLASGRAELSGIVTLDGKPLAGAMVLLVPITIEDPNSIAFLLQDQTNTDGSFELANVIPGQYILVSIDHGWQINWGDASTLRGYLMQGVPVDLKSSAIVKQNVAAQAP